MISATDQEDGPFVEHAKRFVSTAWRVSQQMKTGAAADLREHQQQLFSDLAAMVQARSGPVTFAPEIERGLRRLATQTMRFVMCGGDKPHIAQALARSLADRAFPLLLHFNNNPDGATAALPVVSQAVANQNVIRIDFHARQRC